MQSQSFFFADTGLPVTRIETPRLRVARRTVDKHVQPVLVGPQGGAVARTQHFA